MKITCSKDALLKAVQLVQNVAGDKGTLPVLSNLLMESSKDRVQLTATNLETGIRYNFPAQVLEQGACTIPARKLGDIARELPDAEVQIEADKEDKITITCQRTTFKVNGLPKDEFPALPVTEGEYPFRINQSLLAEMLQKTVFAAAHDETRYILNGVYFIIDQSRIKMVATDGHRLTIADGQVKDYKGERKGVVVPHKILNELIRDLGEEGEAEVSITPNQIFFRLNNLTLTSRLIEGEFPNYEQIIPKEPGKKMRVNTTKLLEAIKRSALFAEAKGNAISLTASPDRLLIEAQTPELGEAHEEMEVAFEGEESRVTYNARYLLDVLKNIGSPEVYLEFGGPLSPGVVRPTDSQDYLCIIMPMKGGS